MQIRPITAKSILTKTGGFLGGNSEYAMTHTLNAYTGCSLGNTSCGAYCYSQHMPNWTQTGKAWGSAVYVKENAPELLRKALKNRTRDQRNKLRIFMSSVTDPYQPIEKQWRITENVLDVFAEFPDLGLLIVQTRSDLVTRDIPLLQRIPYAVVSMTIETDREEVLKQLGPTGIPPRKRFEAVSRLHRNGIRTQIAVSPCLPYSWAFAEELRVSRAFRFVIDTLTDGDGKRGERTAASPIAQRNLSWNWRNRERATELYAKLKRYGLDVGWSDAGFCAIPSQAIERQQSMFGGEDA